ALHPRILRNDAPIAMQHGTVRSHEGLGRWVHPVGGQFRVHQDPGPPIAVKPTGKDVVQRLIHHRSPTWGAQGGGTSETTSLSVALHCRRGLIRLTRSLALRRGFV